MKVAAITAILAASLATAEVIWTFQKFENGVEVPFDELVGPQTEFQSQTMKKIGESRKRNRLNRRATDATVTSTNWCGSATTGTGFTSVVGTWTVPAITLRSGQSANSDPAISQWVGIDGFNNDALIQGGTLSQLVGGRQSNEAWTEMLPASLRTVNLAVSTGDSITTNVTMNTATTGTVTIRNNRSGSSIVGTVSGGTRVTGTSAEWILEDFEEGSSLIAFAAFPTSSFTGSAIHSGTSTTPSAGTLIELVQNSELCSATVSGTGISVKDS